MDTGSCLMAFKASFFTAALPVLAGSLRYCQFSAVKTLLKLSYVSMSKITRLQNLWVVIHQRPDA